MGIFNLTQHQATPDQLAAGVIEPSAESKTAIRYLLTFNKLPTAEDLHNRAVGLAQFARQSGHRSAMIGGAGYLMRPLENALLAYQIRPLHAFSVRESVEVTLPDGAVTKQAVFRHAGFVGAEYAEWPTADDEPGMIYGPDREPEPA